MIRLIALSLSLVLMLAAFPLISMGTTDGPAALWVLGLGLLVLGGLIPPIARFVLARLNDAPPTRVGLKEDERIS
ncbi:MAG: hypothetical protein WDA25_10455 [Paracoccaceae bacterium]